MPDTRPYEVWVLSRTPPVLVALFRSQDDALSYISRNETGTTRHDIRLPDGTWQSRRKTVPSFEAIGPESARSSV